MAHKGSANPDPVLYKANHLNKLLKASETDSILMLQRSAALYFHAIINDYRQSKRKGLLQWDEALWLAAINHCTWMIEHEKLTHIQRKGTNYFTGNNPGDRVAFVVGKNMGGYGENALYNFHIREKSLDDQARTMATAAFEDWKESPGHHKNMIEAYGSHGVAFILAGDTCWAVDVFTFMKIPFFPMGSLATTTVHEISEQIKSGKEKQAKVIGNKAGSLSDKINQGREKQDSLNTKVGVFLKNLKNRFLCFKRRFR